MNAEVGNEEHAASAVTRLIASGAGATGVAAGGVAGFLIGGPDGAITGGLTGALLQDGMKAAVGEVAERLTTRTERERVGSCLVLAHELIAERLNAGQPLRDPGFFKRVNAKHSRSCDQRRRNCWKAHSSQPATPTKNARSRC